MLCQYLFGAMFLYCDLPERLGIVSNKGDALRRVDRAGAKVAALDPHDCGCSWPWGLATVEYVRLVRPSENFVDSGLVDARGGCSWPWGACDSRVG